MQNNDHSLGIACLALSAVKALACAGFTALDKEPTVIQVPDFGDRFYVYAMYDQRTDEIGRIGKQYGTKPGFYMIVGPNWKGDAPKGITAVVRSSTDLVFIVPRIGTLEYKDGAPSKETVTKAYDYLDLMHAVEAFVNAYQGPSEIELVK